MHAYFILYPQLSAKKLFDSNYTLTNPAHANLGLVINLAVHVLVSAVELSLWSVPVKAVQGRTLGVWYTLSLPITQM